MEFHQVLPQFNREGSEEGEEVLWSLGVVSLHLSQLLLPFQPYHLRTLVSKHFRNFPLNAISPLLGMGGGLGEGEFKKTSYNLLPLGHLLRSSQLMALTVLDSFLPEHIPSISCWLCQESLSQLHSAVFLPFKSQSKCQPRGTFPDHL